MDAIGGIRAESAAFSPAPEATGLELRLFGPMEVRVGGQPLPRLRSRKGLWLLALLALRAGRDVEREWLSGTLWPDFRDDAARRSLRQSLHDLRLALGPEAGRLSSESPRTLRLDLSSGGWSDVLAFDSATNAIGHKPHPTALESIVHLYRGPLLEDCTEDWVLDERRQRERQYLSALEILARTAASCEGHTAAAGYLRLAVGIDPLREDLQRALMESLAANGSVSAALLAFRQFRTCLWQEMATEPDVETTALYRRLRSGARKTAHTETPVLAAAQEMPAPERVPSALPQPRTALIGREEDEGKVADCFTRARLVTLTGTGGVGKTRLALRVAEKLGNDFESGARFANLAALSDPAGVPEAVRQALDMPPPQGEEARQPLTEALCRYLSPRRLLLVLDNCEQVLQSCANLTDALLAACPGLRVLATSRQALGLRGESVWRVPSLALPPDSASEAEYRNYAAVRLFIARARDADSTFQVTPRSIPALLRVCRRLDGIPLAIELAAARARVLTVEEIDVRLVDQFRLLTGGDRAAQPRQQTLRGALDWSWNLLTEPERVLLARLSVFAGGCTLEASETICAGEIVDEADILDLMTALMDKSLVVAERIEDGTTRYHLLETVRQYGRGRLAEYGDTATATVQTRHQEYFATLTAHLMPSESLDSNADKAAVLRHLEIEQDNLRAALEWRGAVRESSQVVAWNVLDMAGNLSSFWLEKARLKEGEERLRAAISFADEAWTDKSAGSFQAARIKALRGLSELVWEQGDYASAQALFEETIAACRQLGDQGAIAAVLARMGGLAIFQSDFARGRSFLEEALALYRGRNDHIDTARVLTALGVIAGDQDDSALAYSLLEEALAIHQEIGNERGIAQALTNLGNTARGQGDYVTARGLLEKALEIHRHEDNQRCVAVVLLNLGGCTGDLGDYSAAWSQIEEALSLFREAGNKDMIALSLIALGIVASSQKEYDQARTLLAEALGLNRDLGNWKFVAMTLEYLGAVDASQGHFAQAMSLWGAAETQREALNVPLKLAERLEHEERVAGARAALGEDAADTAWAEGRATDISALCHQILRSGRAAVSPPVPAK